MTILRPHVKKAEPSLDFIPVPPPTPAVAGRKAVF